MDTLSKTFATNTREEIVALCDNLAKIIREELSKNPERKAPIIISLQSADNAGKSAFWDLIREWLFIKGGIFIKKHSHSSQEGGRVYETWQGQVSEEGRPLRLLNCNVGALMYEHMARLPIDTLYKIMGKGESITRYDIIILSKSSTEFIDPCHHTLEINIHDLGGNYPKNWFRRVECVAPPGSPFTSLLQS